MFRNIRFCFIAGTLDKGGAEQQLYYLVKTLRKHNAEVKVMTLNRAEFWEQPIRDLGAEVVWVGETKSKFKRLKKMIRVVSDFRPQIIQSQHFFTNLYAALIGRRFGIFDIGASRSQPRNELKSAGYVLGILNLHSARRMVVNSKSSIATMVKLGRSRESIYYLHNAVDTDHFYPVENLLQNAFTFLAAGRLISLKRFDLFLNALDVVSQMSTGRIKGLISGDGPERADLENLARKKNLYPDVVDFTGEIADLAPIYRLANVLVVTSEVEGTPNVVLEAMASGLPIISTDVGDIPEMVRNGHTGFLFKKDDLKRLCELMSLYFEDRELLNIASKNSRDEMVNRYSLSKFETSVLDLYSPLVG